MAKASCIAGFAFEKSALGINHSVAHAIGGKFHIAHGKINGIILPYVIRFNSEDKTTAQRYYEISKDLGFPTNSIEEGAESLAVAVELLNKNLNLPSCVKDLAIDEEKYRKRLERRLQRTFYFIIPENVTVKVGEDVDISKEGVIARKAGQSYLENLVIESNFDKNTPGTYEAVYKVEIDGKEHKRTRTITVTE